MTIIASTANDGTVPAISESPPPASQNAPSPTTTGGSFDQINSAIKNISDALTNVQNTKDKAGDALSQLEKLFGGGTQQSAPPPQQGPGVLTMILIGSLVVLGGLVVWKLVKRGAE